MSNREQHIRRLSGTTLDVLIVGGGINGAVSAAALVARGVKVGLIDARDFAGFTSQQSSNLVWGGIKYLETYEFALVSKLCKARNTLIKHYPSVVKEIRFLTSIPNPFVVTPADHLRCRHGHGLGYHRVDLARHNAATRLQGLEADFSEPRQGPAVHPAQVVGDF
jgi:choline dehydrogenase-like flavoprotein